MSPQAKSLPSHYFDALYAADQDPWRFASSPYEAEKYKATLAALPRSRYEFALEVGCSIGVLTQKLALRCDRLLAIDASAAPLAAAGRRCANIPNIEFKRLRAPAHWPIERFDLILLSEVLYYFDERDVAATAVATERTTKSGGNVILVHWTGATDYPLSGDNAADLFIAHAECFARVLLQQRTKQYRLDVLERRPLPQNR